MSQSEAKEIIDRAYAQLEGGEEFNLTMMDFSDLVAETTSQFIARERLDPETDKLCIASIARLIRLHNSNTAEFSLIVADDYQGHGLGTEMVRRLIDVGRQEGLDRIFIDAGFEWREPGCSMCLAMNADRL